MSAPPLDPGRILQTGLGFWPAKTLLSAIEMGVFSELARGPERYDTLVGRLGLHQRSARDFLDTLVALGFLTRDGDRYGNTPETDLFLDRRKPAVVAGRMVRSLDREQCGKAVDVVGVRQLVSVICVGTALIDL